MAETRRLSRGDTPAKDPPEKSKSFIFKHVMPLMAKIDEKTKPLAIRLIRHPILVPFLRQYFLRWFVTYSHPNCWPWLSVDVETVERSHSQTLWLRGILELNVIFRYTFLAIYILVGLTFIGHVTGIVPTKFTAILYLYQKMVGILITLCHLSMWVQVLRAISDRLNLRANRSADFKQAFASTSSVNSLSFYPHPYFNDVH